MRDESSQIVRRIGGSREKGLHRASWDLRYPAATPTQLDLPPDKAPSGQLALPGRYTVTLAQEIDGVISTLAGPETFEVVPLELATFAAENKAEALAFQQKVARLQRAVQGAIRVADETQTRIAYLREAFRDTPTADSDLLTELQKLQQRLNGILTRLRGDRTREKRQEPTSPSVNERVEQVVSSQWNTTSAPTQTQRDAYRLAGEEFSSLLSELRDLIEQDLAGVEKKLEAAGAPWTPGRVPTWSME